MTPRFPLLVLVAALVTVALFAPPASHAQTAGSPSPRDATIQRLQSWQAGVAARSDLDAATKQRIDGLYSRAIRELQRADEFDRDSEALRVAVAGASAELSRLERELAAADRASARIDPAPAGLSAEELAQRVSEAQAARDDVQQTVDNLSRREAELSDRPVAARRERENARAEIDRLQAELAREPPTGAGAAVIEARRALASARMSALQAELGWLDREAARLPSELRVVQLKRDIARVELARKDAALRVLADALDRTRRADVERARVEAEKAQASLATQPAAVRRIAERNAALATQLAETTDVVDRALREAARARTAAADLDARQRKLRQEAEGRRLGPEFAQQLAVRIRSLPSPDAQARARAARARLHDDVADANLGVSRELAALDDLSAATAQALATSDAPPSGPERARVEQLLRDELVKQRTLLLRLDEQQQALLQALREANLADEDLAARVKAIRAEMIRLLFWVPLSPVSLETFSDAKPAVAWLFSPANWQSARDALVDEIRASRLAAALVVLAAILLYALRGRWKAELAVLAPAAVGVDQYRVTHTVKALLLTLLLAVPGALVLGAAGYALLVARNASDFAAALGSTLVLIANTTFALYGFSWLFDARGVAVKHFGWPAEAMRGLKRGIRRFALAYIPVLFIAVLGSRGPVAIAETFGRLAFIAAMLVTAFFLHRLFRRSSSVMHVLLPPESRSWPARFHPLWHALVVLVPLALAVLSATGFFFAALAMHMLVKRTLLLVFAGITLFGLVNVWVLVQRARLARKQAGVPAEPAETLTPEGAPVALPAPVDIARLGSQSRQLLNLVAIVLLAVGVWLIWRDAIPILDAVGDTQLWSYIETVDGEQATRAVTLGTVLLALAVLALTLIGTRNIGAVLDIVLLQRLGLEQDATYAIKTIARYVIVGIGVITVSNLLHVSWSKLQWLVAALGVGLGFGLQEIVANFVSGLIVLGERPIRIGDVVTVGQVSGTVTRIRARATVVTDFENKEVIIPNKAFITERVVNWTLSSKVTRLLIPIGVAYGTDVEQAQRVMLEAVRSVPEVLDEPGYSAFFVGFGDSSLNFEVRAYVDSIDKRLRTQHAVNMALAKALAKAGIEIPFPQRDLHIRSAEGLAGLGPAPGRAAVPGSRAGGA